MQLAAEARADPFQRTGKFVEGWQQLPRHRDESLGDGDFRGARNPLDHLNGEIKRRAYVVGIVPNEDAIIRLVGAIPAQQNDEWA